jgi:hypothetical protein
MALLTLASAGIGPRYAVTEAIALVHCCVHSWAGTAGPFRVLSFPRKRESSTSRAANFRPAFKLRGLLDARFRGHDKCREPGRP